MTDAPEPFDRALRRRRRDRAAPGFAGHDFIRARVVDDLLDRLSAVNRRFGHALDLGCADGALGRMLDSDRVTYADAGFRFAWTNGGVQCDEDRLPFADASFDLVVSAGTLHGVNDLPGALALIRRVLKPDGLFLASFIGGDSLVATRAAMLAGDLEHGPGAAPHIHPAVDVRAAGALLQRAGFALPVVDIDTVNVRYSSLFALAADLRGAGETNLLHARSRLPLTRAALATAAGAFAAAADQGKTAETIEIITMTGWAPGPGQPQPLKPGSGKTSLAGVLGKSF